METNQANDAVLVTGATGVLGSALLDLLTDRPVFALYRREPGQLMDNVTWVRGDTTEPGMGLGDQFAPIAASVSRVVHMAAIVDFTADDETYQAVNVIGTRNAVEFARAAGAEFIHVSSAFVTRWEASRRIVGSGCAAGRDAYILSKQAGEAAVRESGLPYVILRPSLVIGDSESGAISRQQGLHSFLGAWVTGLLPASPLSAGTVPDFVPQDILAAAIVRVLDQELDGGTYFLTGGNEALSVEEIHEVAMGVRRQHGLDEVEVPFISFDTMQRLYLPMLGRLGRRVQKQFENMLALSAILSETRFPSDFGHGRFSGIEISSETAKKAIERTMELYFVPREPAVAS